MAKPYSPKGKALLLLQAIESEPHREFTSAEAAAIMQCDRRAVAAQLEYPRRHGLLFLRKQGHALFLRGKPYSEQEGGNYCTRRTMQEPKAPRGWTPSPDDLRIPRVVPGWRPPVMVPPRGC